MGKEVPDYVRNPGRKSLLSALVPLRPTQSVHPHRPLLQGGSRSQNQWLPPQDDSRMSPNPRKLSPQDSFCKAITGSYPSSNAQRSRPSPGKAQQTTPSDRSASTASLTESEQLSSSDRSHAMPVVVKH